MNAGLGSLIKTLLLVLLVIFLASVIYSLMLLLPLNKNLDDEKNNIRMMLMPSFDRLYRAKQSLLKRQPSSRYSLTSLLSHNYYLNIQHSITPTMGLYELEIGLRAERGINSCKGFTLQLAQAGKSVKPYKLISWGLLKNLDSHKNSLLERFVGWKLRVNSAQLQQGLLTNITVKSVKDNVSFYVQIAKNLTTPVVSLKKLLDSNNKEVLLALATNTRISDAIQKALLQRLSPRIDRYLAKNKNTPASVLMTIAKRYRNSDSKDHLLINRHILSNRNVDSDTVSLVFLSYKKLHFMIASHAKTSSKTLVQIYNSANSQLRRVVLRHKSIPHNILQQQLKIVSNEAYFIIAMNSATDEKLLLTLIQNAHLLDKNQAEVNNRIEYERISSDLNIVEFIRHKMTAIHSSVRQRVTILSRNSLFLLDPKVAKNYTWTPQLSPSETLLTLVALHPRANESVLSNLSKKSLFAIDNLLSRHKNTPTKILESLIRRKQWVSYMKPVVSTKGLSEKDKQLFLEELSLYRHNMIMSNISNRPELDSDFLQKVRQRLLINLTPYTAAHVVSKFKLTGRQFADLLKIKNLSKTNQEKMQQNLSMNPYTPKIILLKLAKTGSKIVQRLLVQRQTLSSELQLQIALNTKVPRVLEILAGHSGLSSAVQAQLVLVTTRLLNKVKKKSYQVFRLTRIFIKLVRNTSTRESILKKIASLDISRVNSVLLQRANVSNRLRNDMLSLLLYRKNCRYFIAYDPKHKPFDRFSIKSKTFSENHTLAIFDVILSNDTASVLPVINLGKIPHKPNPGIILGAKAVEIDSRKIRYSVSHHTNVLLVSHRNKVNQFNSAMLSLVSWIVSELVSTTKFQVNGYQAQLDGKSFVNFYIANNSYISIIYFAFILMFLLLLAVLLYSSKIRIQKASLVYENEKLDSNMRRKAYIAELLGHEIKSPLHSLQQLLRSDKKSQVLIKRIHQAILKFATLEAEISGLDGVMTEIDVNDFLTNYCLYAQQYKSISRLEFSSSVPQLRVFTSTEDLEIVLDHIVNNANDFRAENTKITIRSYREKDKVVVKISNQGPCISEELLADLFEFGSSSRSHLSAENLGQGLFIVREKLKELKAIIRVSNLPNGVAFEISLPVIPA